MLPVKNTGGWGAKLSPGELLASFLPWRWLEQLVETSAKFIIVCQTSSCPEGMLLSTMPRVQEDTYVIAWFHYITCTHSNVQHAMAADFSLRFSLMSFRIPRADSKEEEQIASCDRIARSHAYKIAVIRVSFSQIRIKFWATKNKLPYRRM